MGTINSVKFNNTIFDQCSSEYVDLSKAVISPNEKAYHLSGLKIISEIIEGYIKEIADGVFIEYNLLGSVLDNNVKGESKLSSFTYTRENTFSPNFNENICKYTTAIIDALYDHDFTLFHHPDLFIDAIIPKVVYSLINEDDNCVINPEVERLIKDKLLSKNSPQINITSGESLFPILTPSLDPKQLLSDHQDSLIEHAQHKIYVGSFQFGRDYNYTIKLAQRIREEKNITLENAVNEFHKYYHTFLRNNSNLPNHTSVLMTIPVFGANSHEVFDSIKKQNIQGQSIIFLFFTVNKDKKNITELNESLSRISIKLYEELGNRIRFFAINYLFNLGIHLFRRAQIESLKSAKAAIMSRNMSHNLGSHVMFYIKQKLQSVSKIVDNKVLDNIIPGNIATIADIEEKIKANKDIELPFLVGLGRFINYLQERQDYIATIATDYIPANSTISFKDFVYDELKPDLRYERHYSQNNDAGWQPGNLLLDYIAYSERYRSCNDIEILFGEFDGRNPQEKGSPSDVDFKKLREFNIAVPGGVVGRQAIFSIFENIIRNAAKHSGRRNDNKLVLQLSLLGKDDNLFNSDDFKSIRNDDMAKYDVSGNILKAKYEECFDKYHVLRIKIDMPNDAKTVNKLVEKLADPYLEENGNMKESSKGLKEMRISAAWLRGYSIDTEIPANEPPALSIYTEPYDNSKVTISYIVCLPKPCKVAFVVECDNSDTVNGLLTPYGCKVFTDPFKLKDEEDRDKLINEIANYEIVCMPTNLKAQLCPYISSRYIINEDQTETLLKNLTDSIEKTNYKDKEAKKEAIENSIGSIYETWFGTTYNDDILKLVVADEKAVENKKTEKETGSLSSDNNVILTATTSVTKEEVNEAVVYSTHFKGLFAKNDKDSEPEGYNGMLADAISIESVTGNNSTARLIRQDKWNKEWKIKLISSGIARVAIFDERIFSSFISRESTAHKDSLNVETILELKNENLNDFKKILWDNYRIPNNVSGKIFFEKNQEKINKALEKYLTLYHYTHDVAQKNHERGIWAFDIRIAGEVNERVEIVGYNVHIGNRVGLYNEHKTDAIITIAKISRHSEIGQYDVELCDDKKVFEDGKSNVFDYISIHQGVLDKIYTAFGIKDQEVEKYKVTNALHRCFSKQETPMDVKELLPNFIIHSGRSKPSKNDMPQSQPFVQFAAIDSAVKDCKYTLVELLATAHYEKGNNNN